FLKGSYHCLEQEEYVDIVCDFLERIPNCTVIQRLTGDPHSEELVAPLWSLDKTRTLSLIRERLEKRNTWQGRLIER
ncbi:MAG: TIGR01212 family radical SAM protein, partial [Desulfobacterales bacterium]